MREEGERSEGRRGGDRKGEKGMQGKAESPILIVLRYIM